MRCLHTRTSHKVLTHTHTHTHTSHEVLTHEQRKRLVCVKMKEEGIEAHARDDETD